MFDGADYNEKRDRIRLTGQMNRIFNTLNDVGKYGGWLSVQDIALVTGDREISVAAQIRNLRKPKFGGHDIRRRRAYNTYQFRLFPK